jgi:tetratricopeptide (TPR) repeat protein
VRIAIAGELVRQILHRALPDAWLHRTPPPPALSDAVLQTLWFHQFIDFSSDLERLLYDILRALNIAERAGASHRTLRSYFGMSVMCHNIGLAGMGRRYADMADAMAARVGGTLAEAIAHASLGLDGYAVGDWDRATQELAASAEGYLASGDLEPWAPINAYRAIVLVARGRLAESLQLADAVEQTGRAARDRRMETLGAHIRGHVLSWAGREREAVTEYQRAIASYRVIPDHHLWLSATGTLAKAYLRLDEPDAARGPIDEGVRLARDHRLRGWHMTPLLTARSELLLRDAVRQPRDRASQLAAADAACGELRGQGRLHYEAVPAVHRQRGSLEWLRGRPERAWAAWRRSLDAADRLGAITDRLETHEAIARYTASAADRDQAESIAARLRAGVPAAAA